MTHHTVANVSFDARGSDQRFSWKILESSTLRKASWYQLISHSYYSAELQVNELEIYNFTVRRGVFTLLNNLQLNLEPLLG